MSGIFTLATLPVHAITTCNGRSRVGGLASFAYELCSERGTMAADPSMLGYHANTPRPSNKVNNAQAPRSTRVLI